MGFEWTKNAQSIKIMTDNVRVIAEIDETAPDRLILRSVRNIYSISFVVNGIIDPKDIDKMLKESGMSNGIQGIFSFPDDIDRSATRWFIYFFAPLDKKWVDMFDMARDNKNARVLISLSVQMRFLIDSMEDIYEIELFENNIPFEDM